MRILLLNQYFPPDTSATAKMAAQVAQALAERHEVTVIAGRPSYDPEVRYSYRLRRREECDGMIVERVGSTSFSRHQMRGRVLNYLSYLALSVPSALVTRADVILAMTDPPVVGIAGALIARMMRRPFVYNIRDLYPDMAVGGGIVRPGRWVARWEKLHRWALRQAESVIVLGEDMRERILAKGIPADRVVVVRDGTSFSAAVPEPEQSVVQEIRAGSNFVVLHAGNLGFYGAWNTLLRAARMLEGDGVDFVFVGDGANRARVEDAARGCSKVRFLPFRPIEELPCVMAAGDLQVITLKRGLEGVVVPSKFYSILAAGRPVLAVTPEESDVARLTREAGCGVVADPDDPDSVVTAIRSVLQDPARLAEMGRRAREAASNSARQNELRHFVSVVEKAAGGRAGNFDRPVAQRKTGRILR